MFDVIPAIDLLDGKAVRLEQGQYESSKIYNADPLALAESFTKMGFKRLHVVDLAGAKEKKPVHAKLILEMAKLAIEIDIGGGIRTEADVELYLSGGIRYVVLGSVLIQEPVLAQTLLRKWSDRIIVGIDSKNDQVAVNGWLEQSSISLVELAKKMQDWGAQTLIATDIRKDGMLSGPNFEMYQKLAEKTQLQLIASGGVTTAVDLQNLKKIPQVCGAIIGKAIYEQKLDLQSLLYI